MLPSMRNQARLKNARKERDNAETNRRNIAFKALCGSKYVEEAVKQSGISRTMGDRINVMLQERTMRP